MMKVRVEAEAPPGMEPYWNLRPVLEALLASGNQPARVYKGHQPDRLGFYQDKGAGFVTLRSQSISTSSIPDLSFPHPFELIA
jgi:hypothetical protein